MTGSEPELDMAECLQDIPTAACQAQDGAADGQGRWGTCVMTWGTSSAGHMASCCPLSVACITSGISANKTMPEVTPFYA